MARSGPAVPEANSGLPFATGRVDRATPGIYSCLMTEPQSPPSQSQRPEPRPTKPPTHPPARPWRTEGLPPEGQGPTPGSRWPRIGFALLIYTLFFGLLTMQDRLSDPETLPYTEFK